jgi:hypothetical protein
MLFRPGAIAITGWRCHSDGQKNVSTIDAAGAVVRAYYEAKGSGWQEIRADIHAKNRQDAKHAKMLLIRPAT